jgi:hypothetical protein
MLSNVVWGKDGAFKPFSSIDPFDKLGAGQDKLTENFARRVLKALKKRGLIDDATEEQILSQEHSGFSVWVGEPFQDKARELFVARYIERGPVSLEKLSLEGDKVVYTTKEKEEHIFDNLEFLALLSSHIPNPGESLTRYFGRYSNRNRGERKKSEPKQAPSSMGPETLPEPKKKPSFLWAECMKRTYEINPMLCPKCGKEMRIISFITDYHELQKIIASMDRAKAQAPPPGPNSTLASQPPLAA